MPATLNQDDIKLLESVFVTKRDLVAMEKRQDAKYATKENLQQFATRTELKQMIEESELSIIHAVTNVELDLRSRITKLEDTVGISPAN